jgi:hypothetical protein
MYKIKKPDIKMKYSDFVEEHIHLIKILRKGNEEEREEEAEDQCKELKKYLSDKEVEELELDKEED